MPAHRTIRLVGNDSAPIARVVRAGVVRAAPSHREDPAERNVLRRPWEPVLLAGPIVRRATPEAIWIWLATSVPVQIDARLGIEPSVLLWDDHPMGRGHAEAQKIGERLYVALVPIRPAPAGPRDFQIVIDGQGQPPRTGFWTDEPLAYNLELTIPESQPWRFEAELSQHAPCAIRRSRIAVGRYHLPTVLIPGPERRTQVFLHASCRKLHGYGDDAISEGLRHLESVADDPERRPAALYLTGDQIYSDDVHPGVIASVVRLSELILGFDEEVPTGGWTGRYGAGERGRLVQQGFSSGHGASHLLGFGECAAMYLLAWSGDLWDEFRPPGGIAGEGIAEPAPADAQRLLANVSTYMIFDDHEVTDDWNLNHRWRERVQAYPLTFRVVANAIAAFGTFQGMGNDPGHQFFTPPPGPEPEWDGAGLAWGLRWGFVSGARPPVVVLDTRTRRHLERDEPFPGLMDAAELGWLRDRLAELRPGDGQPVVLVSPPPVLGLEAIEVIQEELVRNHNVQSTTVDGEAWSLNRNSFAAFMDTLVASGHPRFVFLSGDVHYAFTAVGRYSAPGDRGTRSIELVQFCSSATKNAAGGAGQAAIPALQSDRVQRIAAPTWELRWRLYRPVTSNNVGVVTIGPGWVEQVLLVSRMRAGDRARSPYTQRITWNDFPIS